MPTSIITTEDLIDFKMELLEEFEQLLAKYHKSSTPISWLRSSDVKEKLKISTGTLQKLRDKKIIKGHKIEGIFFYDAAEIDRILLENGVQINEQGQ